MRSIETEGVNGVAACSGGCGVLLEIAVSIRGQERGRRLGVTFTGETDADHPQKQTSVARKLDKGAQHRAQQQLG